MEIKLTEEMKKSKILAPAMVRDLMHKILENESEVDQDKEHMWVIGVNIRGKPKYIELVALGTLEGVLISPREIFRTAILKGVKGIIMVHNHPSGEVEPSKHDLKIIEEISKAGDLLRIKLIDFVIIGNGNKEELYSALNDDKIPSKEKQLKAAADEENNKKEVST